MSRRQLSDRVPVQVGRRGLLCPATAGSTFEEIARDFFQACTVGGWTDAHRAEQLARLLVDLADTVAPAPEPLTDPQAVLASIRRRLLDERLRDEAGRPTTFKGAGAIRRRLDDLEQRIAAVEERFEAFDKADRDVERDG